MNEAAGSTLLRADPAVKRDSPGMFRNLSRHLRRRGRAASSLSWTLRTCSNRYFLRCAIA